MVQKKLESEIDCVITDLILREKRLIYRQKWLDNSAKLNRKLHVGFGQKSRDFAT